MYGRGIQQLLDALPRLEGLDADKIRRLLSRAWLDVTETRELDAVPVDPTETVERLRRLALALQLHAVLLPDLTTDVHRACSFVAAESLDIAQELSSPQGDDPRDTYEQLLIALLYLIAGYDANASVVVRDLALSHDLSAPHAYVVSQILAFLRGGSGKERPRDPDAVFLHERVRSGLLRRIGDLSGSFNLWLRDPDRQTGDEPSELLALANELRIGVDEVPVSDHVDVQHLARILGRAMHEAQGRAARAVPAPPTTELFQRFLRLRCASQPLLWPAAQEFSDTALGANPTNAVVAVPTGAGKSAVADLAIQHSIHRGWVVYLAPTNALVGQIQRQLRHDHPGLPIRQFLGGAEYTSLADESFTDVAVGQVLVMTPEKCLANSLRGVFSSLRNPTAHEPKIRSKLTEQDAVDELGHMSYLHRCLDECHDVPAMVVGSS